MLKYATKNLLNNKSEGLKKIVLHKVKIIKKDGKIIKKPYKVVIKKTLTRTKGKSAQNQKLQTESMFEVPSR